MTTKRVDAATAVAIAAGGALSVALGVYGSVHAPTGEPITTLGFPSMFAMKVWLSAAVGVLAVGQVIGALWMYGKLPIAAPSWLGKGHRAAGYLAVALSIPVAYHCLWSLGFEGSEPRVLVHSLAGCAVYGAFVTKVFAVRSKTAPSWLLPVAGGTLFTTLIATVLVSAVWYFTTAGVPR